MKHYIISNSADKKEVGHYIQTVMGEVPNENGEFDNNARSNLNNENFPNFIPNLEFELEPKAKITDIVSASDIIARGLLINDKVRSLLSNFNIMNHKFYDGRLKTKDKILPYYWLHIANNSFSGIDFDKSTFCIADLIGNPISLIIVKDENDYYEKNALCEDMNSIIIDKLIFNDHFRALNLDLFFFPQIHQYIIASERLINEIEKQKITGLKYKEAMFI